MMINHDLGFILRSLKWRSILWTFTSGSEGWNLNHDLKDWWIQALVAVLQASYLIEPLKLYSLGNQHKWESFVQRRYLQHTQKLLQKNHNCNIPKTLQSRIFFWVGKIRKILFHTSTTSFSNKPHSIEECRRCCFQTKDSVLSCQYLGKPHLVPSQSTMITALFLWIKDSMKVSRNHSLTL